MYAATATEGDDRIAAAPGGAPLNGRGGDDYLYGTSGGDDLDGAAGDDWLEGYGGDDILRANGGYDRALAGLGTDTLVLDYSALDSQEGYFGRWEVTADAEGGYRGLWSINDTTGVFFSSIEKFDLRFGDVQNWVVTGDGDDRISGGGGSDRLEGGGGDDLLDGGADGDKLYGGAGNDIYIVDDRWDTVNEEAGGGRDEIRIAGPLSQGGTSYTLPAEVEDLTITSAAGWTAAGNAANNRLRLGDGGDQADLTGGGNDRVEGGGGNDYLYFGGAFTLDDAVDGGAGHDTLGLQGAYSLAFGADSLTSIEQITLFAGTGPGGASLTTHDANVAAGAALTIHAAPLAADQSLHFNGSAESDGRFTVTGGRGADTITGGAGADIITGGGGGDSLRGGRGADTFTYARADESTAGATDIVHDFEAGDRINLAAIDADANAANGDSKFAWIGGAAFSGQAGELRAVRHADYNRAWVIEADTNGDTIADFTLIVVAQPGYILSKADFWV